MDIHKPKPWHGLREFLKEYLIIVVGVLTALGAEAVVEKLHERRLSAEAREAVRAEINLDLANMKQRGEMQGCIDRRLDEISRFLADAEAGRPVTPLVTVAGPIHPVAYTERWQAATAGGRASLLSSDEQRDFIRVYKQFENHEALQAEERIAWGDLVGLQGVQHPSAELLAHARIALGRAKMLNRTLQGNVDNATAFAARIGIRGEDPQLLRPGRPKVFQICMPVSTPPDEAARQSGQKPIR